jgi:DNA-binding NarL/FixJ family response regulator
VPVKKIRLLVADDHEILREGLRLTFANTDVQIVVEAEDGEAAFEALQHHEIDVALIDISMPRADGFRFLELVRQAKLSFPVIMHSAHDAYLRRCRDWGTQGFVLKGQDGDVLLAAVRAVHAGEEFWSCPREN